MENQSLPEPKILLIGSYNTSEILSGPEKYAKRLYQSLQNNHAVTFATYFESGNYSFYQKLFGFEELSGDSNVIRLGLIRFILLLFGFSYDIIHVVTFSRFAALAYLLPFSKHRIYTAHGIITKEDSAKSGLSSLYKVKNRIAEKIFLTQSNAIITLSPLLHKKLSKYYPETVTTNKTIYPGVDNEFFAGTKISDTSKGLHVLFLGGFAEREKSAYAVIEEVYSKLPQIKIACVGFAYKNLEYLKINYINKTDVGSFVSLLGLCNVFIAPYSGETFSIVTLEAMALGIPVIVNRKAGVAKLIEDNVHGFLFDSEQPAQITQILHKIVENPETIIEISAKAKMRAAEFTWEKTAEHHLNAYKALLIDGRADTI